MSNENWTLADLKGPGKYLKKEDLDKDEDTILTITGGDRVSMRGNGEKKFVLSFEQTKQGFICNSGNLDALFKACGATGANDLEGKVIALYIDPNVEYAGKRVGGVRIRDVSPEMVF